MEERLNLEPGSWFAMTMLPGYFDTPYYSPVRVHHFLPLGDRTFELTYLNAAYASGVQVQQKRFRTLKRSFTFMFAEQLDSEDGAGYLFHQLSLAWLFSNFDSDAVSEFMITYDWEE